MYYLRLLRNFFKNWCSAGAIFVLNVCHEEKKWKEPIVDTVIPMQLKKPKSTTTGRIYAKQLFE